MKKAKRFLPIVISIVFLFTCLAAFKTLSKHYIIQVTDSLPKGIYSIKMDEKIAKGSLVVFEFPDGVSDLIKDRGWVPKHLSYKLMKPVVAVSGDRVKVSEKAVFVNGIYSGRVITRDRQGLPLPTFLGEFMLAVDEVFTSGLDSNSFDSRYFGPVKIGSVVGVAKPVFTFNPINSKRR